VPSERSSRRFILTNRHSSGISSIMTPNLTRRFQHYCTIPELNITVSSAPYEHTTIIVFNVPQAFHGSSEMVLHRPWYCVRCLLHA
jgi:hypothetical protein